MNRVNLAKSLVAARDLHIGDVVTATDVEVKSPGRGLQPHRRVALLGVTLHRDVPAGDFFYPGRPRGPSAVPERLQLPPPLGPAGAVP